MATERESSPAANAAGSVSPRAIVEHMALINPVFQAMAMEIVDVSLGSATLAMRIRPDMGNTFGVCHGGITFALADMAFGFSSNTYNERSVTAGASIEYIAPARVGDRLLAEVRETHRGSRTGLYDVRVSVEGGDTVAIIRGRMRVVGGTILKPGA
ncbi:MAG: hotdog fold thioesterase [Hyphomicrobiaceae bacterium]